MVANDFTYVIKDKEVLNNAVLRAFFDQSDIGMAFFNADGGLLICNNAFVEQAVGPLWKDNGGVEMEVFGRLVWEQIKGAVIYCMKSKSVMLSNVLWLNGQTASLKVTVVELEGGTKGIMVVSHQQPAEYFEDNKSSVNELLSQKSAELELANKEIATFSSMASHDLQEPLRKIQTFSNLLIEKEAEHLSTAGLQYLARMNAAAGRMQKLVDDLLLFSRTSTNLQAKREVDLNDILKKLLNDRKVEINVKGAIIHVEKLPKVHGVEYQLYLLFENLLSNALKFNKPGQPPIIKIFCKMGSALPGRRAGNFDADTQLTYEIAITDEGIGFDQQYHQRIFQLFQRLHGKSESTGTGLGLPICKRIAQNHGGSISAIGQLGVGATFVVLLQGAG